MKHIGIIGVIIGFAFQVQAQSSIFVQYGVPGNLHEEIDVKSVLFENLLQGDVRFSDDMLYIASGDSIAKIPLQWIAEIRPDTGGESMQNLAGVLTNQVFSYAQSMLGDATFPVSAKESLIRTFNDVADVLLAENPTGQDVETIVRELEDEFRAFSDSEIKKPLYSKDDLLDLYEEVKEFLRGTSSGDKPNQYPEESRDELQRQLIESLRVLTDTNNAMRTIDEMYQILNESLSEYKDSQITSVCDVALSVECAIVPNPCSQYFCVKSPIEVSGLEVCSVQGVVLMRQSGSLVDVALLPPGMYVAKITLIDGTAVAKRFIIQ